MQVGAAAADGKAFELICILVIAHMWHTKTACFSTVAAAVMNGLPC
jgi:hypothetical protein